MGAKSAPCHSPTPIPNRSNVSCAPGGQSAGEGWRSSGPLAQAEPAVQPTATRVRSVLEFFFIGGSSLCVALATGAGVGDFGGPALGATSPVSFTDANSWRGFACCDGEGIRDSKRWASTANPTSAATRTSPTSSLRKGVWASGGHQLDGKGAPSALRPVHRSEAARGKQPLNGEAGHLRARSQPPGQSTPRLFAASVEHPACLRKFRRLPDGWWAPPDPRSWAGGL
jgi:hypothetical protein